MLGVSYEASAGRVESVASEQRILVRGVTTSCGVARVVVGTACRAMPACAGMLPVRAARWLACADMLGPGAESQVAVGVRGRGTLYRGTRLELAGWGES